MANGIAAVLATGEGVLDYGELTRLYESACDNARTQVNHWNDSRVALACSLRSIEPHAGRDPFIAEIPTLGIVCMFDGQLHNAAEVRADLPGTPHSRTDSDLAVHAYAHWGETFVGRLRGDFALPDPKSRWYLCPEAFSFTDLFGSRRGVVVPLKCGGDGTAFIPRGWTRPLYPLTVCVEGEFPYAS